MVEDVSERAKLIVISTQMLLFFTVTLDWRKSGLKKLGPNPWKQRLSLYSFTLY